MSKLGLELTAYFLHYYSIPFYKVQRSSHLHLYHKRVISLCYLLGSPADVFIQTWSPFMPSGDSVYTEPVRSDGE